MNTSTAGLIAPGRHDRKNPFLACVRVRRSLTLPGSGKDTRHLELDIAGSGLEYTVGDSLGVFARNPARLVSELLALLQLDPAHPVTLAGGRQVAFQDALTRSYTLNRANRKILHGVLERLPAGEARNAFDAVVKSEELAADYLFTRDYVDVLREFPSIRFESPEAFIKLLSPLQPRLYSIASSPARHPGSVHLCVAVVRYETHGRRKTGLCSGFLADEVSLNLPDAPVFVQESAKFFLPSQPDRDVIMVGPGTGIAPFRAFLEQRQQDGAAGRNWLFFGEQRRATDFLYEDDIHRFQKEGVLTRLDLAFSRDQAEKVYVQHRMLERAAELWKWIQDGAYFYVCGDARRMAKDVHAALLRVAQEQGGLSSEGARAYVEEGMMRTERRYLRDVY
ncbi:MAG: sulfite reductase subunit alpha [Verrucomicrobia bacterium]|nr:sulfite reductase subunit alpha [Verrucomicrobiota bacterium]